MLAEELEQRRNFYPDVVRALDRAQLDRFGLMVSVLDVVRATRPFIIPCYSDSSEMCVRGRSPTLTNPNPQDRVLVCVDDWRSFGPFSELGNLPIESVALIEFYGLRGSQVRVYTVEWMLSRVRTGRTSVYPLLFGC